ncbi:MAG: FtsW/RodA/SpoVE family cell cycle protein [Candidatus Buchananbacteria bacterium]
MIRRRTRSSSRFLTQNLSASNYLHRPDYWLLGSLFFIVFVGLFMLASAGSAVGYQKFGDSFYFIKHQLLVGFLPGLILFFILSRLDYHFWLKAKTWVAVALLALLLSVFIPGLGTSLNKGALSWVQLFGIPVQPSELAKVVFALFFSAFLAQKGEAVKNLWLGVLPVVVILLVVLGLVALQPDFGTMSIFLLMGATLYFVAGARYRHLAVLATVGLVLVGGLLLTSSHAKQRLQTFLNPATVESQDQGYQLRQAMIGIGSGGLLGRGLGYSRQKFQYLPEVTGDSIFAVIGEEMGFLFSAGLIIAFLVLFARAIKVARRAPDKFGELLAVGIISWIIGQAFLNISAMLGLMPLTGVPLPFISYGGSALLAGLSAMGILVNISRQTNVR